MSFVRLILHEHMAKNLFISNRAKNEGSALLISLMVMGILMTLSLGVSQILISTLRESNLLVDKTRAWYAAESGIEHSLLQITENNSGFSVRKKVTEEHINYEYFVRGSSKNIPFKEDFEVRDVENTYAQLELNDSVTIPLFSALQNGDIIPVEKFQVDYYLSSKLQEQGGSVFQKIDVLRWKIFGVAKGGGNFGKMEVMNWFLPMGDNLNSASFPSCLGTELGKHDACYNGGKYFQWNVGTQEYDISEIQIKNFLKEHTQNFLVLTNSINIDLIEESFNLAEKQVMAKINYRVRVLDGGNENAELALPFVRVTSDGFSRDTKQSLNVEVKRESFLPVFNFALYRTCLTDECKGKERE